MFGIGEHTYSSIMAQKDEAFQNVTMATVARHAGVVGAALQLGTQVMNLGGGYSGAGAGAQGNDATGLLQKGMQFTQAAGQIQQFVGAGAQALHAAKVRLVMLTNQAQAQGYKVWPTGLVTMGRFHIQFLTGLRSHGREGEARAWEAKFRAKAAEFTAQIDLVVQQTNSADMQVALSLASSAVSVLGSLMQKEQGSGSQPTIPTTQPDRPQGPIGVGAPLPPGTGADTDTGTADRFAGLAGAGGVPLAGAGATSIGVTAPAGVTGLSGAAGMTPGAIATRGGPGGAAGPAGMAMAPGMYGGAPMAGGHGSQRRHQDAKEWLDEDGDTYAAADVPNEAGGVLS